MVRACALAVCIAAMGWIAGCSPEPPATAPDSKTAPPPSASASRPADAPAPRDQDRSDGPAAAAGPSTQAAAPAAPSATAKPSAGAEGHKSVLSAIGRSLLKGMGNPANPPQTLPEAPRYSPANPAKP